MRFCSLFVLPCLAVLVPGGAFDTLLSAAAAAFGIFLSAAAVRTAAAAVRAAAVAVAAAAASPAAAAVAAATAAAF